MFKNEYEKIGQKHFFMPVLFFIYILAFMPEVIKLNSSSGI